MLSYFLKEFSNYLIKPVLQRLDKIQEEIEVNRILIAQSAIHLTTQKNINDLSQIEFRVFSQFGEDGIIQYLISKIPIPNKTFIEFGSSNYTESNTRFLLLNNNWNGLVIDGDIQNIEAIRRMRLYWRNNLTAIQSFITAENINLLIEQSGIRGDIGLLSIDIDGNDYWVWKAISQKAISPRIVIAEYNSALGNSRALTIPYTPDFQRGKAHFSNLYYGASLKAICALATDKGYHFVGSNSAGNNAFFVRTDLIGDLQIKDSQNGYVESKFREGRDETGKLTFLAGSKRLEIIAHLPVIDLESGKVITLKESIND